METRAVRAAIESAKIDCSFIAALQKEFEIASTMLWLAGRPWWLGGELLSTIQGLRAVSMEGKVGMR
ncbi:MAG: hypothetical protein CMM07_05840 [Rhodopirellula sp.]|nr:hypothetical protein [Rhodopirellula sp.]